MNFATIEPIRGHISNHNNKKKNTKKSSSEACGSLVENTALARKRNKRRRESRSRAFARERAREISSSSFLAGTNYITKTTMRVEGIKRKGGMRRENY